MLRLEQKETYGTHIHTGNSEPSSVLGCDGNGDILFVPLGLFQRMTRRGCKEDYFPCPPFIPFSFLVAFGRCALRLVRRVHTLNNGWSMTAGLNKLV